jgi:hypothetical protein
MAAVAVMAASAGLMGCGLEGVDIPGVRGPSEHALSLTMTATPDILPADGASVAAVRVVARDRDGNLAPGRLIYFSLRGPGAIDREYVVTDTEGIAQVTYRAGAIQNLSGAEMVNIAARPVGTDAGGESYRFVIIELREPLF